ncbi:MAG: hypothetical protein A3H06_00440 [Candidatus Colwellbacteria bacterium RIFCSPLOWO2_12_FULL_44_13]|uniref:Penicillin-binding protein transpeptidase domain-containing protein n=1 Tax=Candidatus Colwellbacteria bacterium RIFCSPLOWO2_12_FULL_44_13 TaxID=1797694 RepID=A0A1G1ZAZ1_9BACT|nr:MAG: hypothetical protein A3H06_00440 [Candidatus Colwellbacteria bacterium RIFCSPLOWO2_12_FULL_44_13]
MGVRISVLIVFFGLFYAVLIGKLYNVQIEKGAEYQARAESINKLIEDLVSKRGSIFLTDKDDALIPAAIKKDYPTIYAIPSKVEDVAEAANLLSGITDIAVETLEKLLNKPSDPYESIVKKAPIEMVDKVKEAAIPGIEIEMKSNRFYPQGTLAAHVVGFWGIGNDNTPHGQYGIEHFYEEKLQGKLDEVEGDKIKEAESGEDVMLTIDRTIQLEAERILDDLVTTYNAESGTVIVEEPKTGKIIALANAPTFDPNKYGESEIKNFLNPAVESIYESGSIFKVITMASGIDAGKITPDTTYNDIGEVRINDRVIKNWDLQAHGRVTMTNVLEESINTGAVFAERQIGHETFLEYLLKFGFENATGVDLPGEVTGNLTPLKKNVADINYATASFGQGISVTPIGLINALAAIANDGYLMRPYITKDKEPETIRRVISKQTADTVTEMMVSAVDKAKVARIKSYAVAGKTGTAQVPDFKNGGYTEDVINTYVGFTPATNPRFIILVKLDKPYGAPLAGLTVVPAFRNLAEFMLHYYNIPPDRL